MAVDYGLVTRSAQVPMSGEPFKMNTPAQNESIRLSMEGKQLDVAEQRQAFDENTQDKQALKGLLSQPDTDLATPDGMQSLLQKAKGAVSPKTYMGLVDHAAKLTQSHVKNQDLLAKMSEDQLGLQAKQHEALAPALDQGRTAYYKDLAEKGQVTATENLRKFTGELFQHTQGMKMPNGQPLYPPELTNSLKDMDAAHMDSILSGTKYMGDQAKQALQSAQAKRQSAEADILESGSKQALQEAQAKKQLAEASVLASGGRGRKPEILLDDEGNKWSVINDREALKNGVDIVPIREMPGNVKHLTAKGAGEKPSEIEPEAIQYAAEYSTTYGKPIPGIPAGVGAAGASARARYINSFYHVGRDKGYTGDEVGSVAMVRDASKNALSNATKQNAIIKIGENDIVRVIGTMEEELKKLGGPDSPKIRGLWNKVATDWIGDPEFKGFNAAYANFLDVSAKVLSGQSGAAGTPISYLELAKKQLGENPNLGQLAEVKRVMTSLFNSREKSVEQEQKELLKASQLTAKPGSVAAEREAGRGAETKVSPAEQADRDKDAVKILRAEYTKEIATLDDPKLAGDARARKLADVRALRRELKKNGVDVPDPGEAPKQEVKKVGPFSDAEKEARYQAYKKAHPSGQ